MHWTDQFGSSGPVGRIVTSRVDPYSGQPELKATPASITPVSAYFHGLLLRRMPGPLPDICHWTRVPFPEGHLYRLSGLDLMPCGQALDDLAASLLRAPERSELLVASDPGRGTLRIAALCDGVVAAALFLAQSLSGLPPDSAVIPILGAPVADSARLGLLSGKRYDKAATEGPRVCACFGVTRDAVRHAVVTHRLQDTRGIGEVLSAGTNCGSCLPELEEILRDVRVPA